MIEDNATNLQLMVYLLTAFGHEPVQALDGAEGLELAGRQQLDLILLDIHMPQMDGYEVVRRLKEHRDCGEIPIVAVTALAMVGDRERILASGFSGYIAKPIDPETFPMQIQGFLGHAYSTKSPPSRQWQQQEVLARATQSKNGGVVLLVDNIQANIELARVILEPSGYQVVGALSASVGFDLARQTKPVLIISDVHMNQQDGYEFLRMLQADPELSHVPFVFLSSSVTSAREQERALQLGAKMFISRPIEPYTLLEQLKEYIPKKAVEQWQKF